MDELDNIFQKVSPDNTILITCKQNELSDLVSLVMDYGYKWANRTPNIKQINHYSRRPIPGLWLVRKNSFLFYTVGTLPSTASKIYTFDEILEIKNINSTDTIVFDDICALVEA